MCVQGLKSSQYLLAGGVAEGDGFKPLAEDILQGEQISVTLRTIAQGTQHVHTPHLKRGAGLYTGTVNILLIGAPLILHLARVTLLDGTMNFWDQSEHVDSFPAEVCSGSDTGVFQELMSGLDNRVMQSVGDLEAFAGGAFFLSLEAPEDGGGIFMESRQKRKESSLVGRHQLFLRLGGRLSFPLLHVLEMFIPFLMFPDFFRGEPWGSSDGGDDGGFIAHEDFLLFRGGIGGMWSTGQGVRVAMESALPVLDGEIETGKDLEPSKDHPGRRIQRANPGEGAVVSTQNKWPV